MAKMILMNTFYRNKNVSAEEKYKFERFLEDRKIHTLPTSTVKVASIANGFPYLQHIFIPGGVSEEVLRAGKAMKVGKQYKYNKEFLEKEWENMNDDGSLPEEGNPDEN